jgi:hypothetical protein
LLSVAPHEGQVGNQVLTSSHRKAAAVIIFMKKPCGIYAARLSRLGAAYSQFPEKKVGGPGTKPQARQF